MSDNINNNINDENAGTEAAKRAERIKAIRSAIRSGESESAAPEVNEYPEENIAENVRLAETPAEERPQVSRLVKRAPAQETEQSRVSAEQPVRSQEQQGRTAAPVKKAPAKKKKKKKKKKPQTLGAKIRGLFPEKGDGALEVIRKFVFLGSIIAIIVFGYVVGDYYLDLWRSRMQYNEIYDIYTTYTPIMTTVEEESSEEQKGDKFYDLLPGAKKLLDINKDVVGYLTIPSKDGDPIVALPVVQSEDNKKYLNLNFKGEESRAGALFLDWRNSFDRVSNHRLTESNSENLIVYGHNMADESMFGKLKYYRRNPDYYGEHPVIQFNSNYETYTYKIFAFFIDDAADDSETKFDCWNKLNFADEADFYDFVNEAKRRTLRTNDVDVKYGDQLLTLSTCNTDIIEGERGRLIILARRVHAGEDPYEGTQNSQPNPNIKWPSIYYESRPNEHYDPSNFVPYSSSGSE